MEEGKWEVWVGLDELAWVGGTWLALGGIGRGRKKWGSRLGRWREGERQGKLWMDLWRSVLDVGLVFQWI